MPMRDALYIGYISAIQRTKTPIPCRACDKEPINPGDYCWRSIQIGHTKNKAKYFYSLYWHEECFLTHIRDSMERRRQMINIKPGRPEFDLTPEQKLDRRKWINRYNYLLKKYSPVDFGAAEPYFKSAMHELLWLKYQIDSQNCTFMRGRKTLERENMMIRKCQDGIKAGLFTHEDVFPPELKYVEPKEEDNGK